MMDIEFLESRRLLTAAAGTAELDDFGNLDVAGTAGADIIFLSIRNSTTLRVTINGTNTDFILADVNSSISVHTDTGDDSITIGPGIMGTYVNAGSGNDSIQGGENSDTLTGGSGDDSIKGGAGDDLLNGYGTNDRINGGSGNDRILGGDGKDLLIGDEGNDTITGGANVDYLYGGTGNDSLSGEGGNDRLIGDLGNDFMSGGAGNDQFVSFDGLADTLNGNGGTDSVARQDAGLDILISIEAQPFTG
jgi:Ca2+-binding RTX toxin-like protein